MLSGKQMEEAMGMLIIRHNGLGADEIIDARELSGAGSRSDGSRIH
jgi:hypothetical protein